MYSSSRTQKVISLSSGEAEVYAASSAACDSILLAKMISFLTGVGVVVHHLLDSSAARGILSRQGVGRILHLSWPSTLLWQCRTSSVCDVARRRQAGRSLWTRVMRPTCGSAIIPNYGIS